MKKVLSIAGSDPSGGAGIQADIKTISAHRMYAMSVETALTVQNTMGVHEVFGIPADFVKKQLEYVLEDIPPDAVKIGMLFSADTISCIAETLDKFGAKNIVLDPVMLSTSGKRLLDETAESILIKKLFPLSDLVTPNIHEAEKISGIKINSIEDIKKAASLISKQCKGSVLVKGGHFEECTDVLYFENQFFIFDGKRINNPNTHGTGCTLSSAIACSLAAGKSIPESVMLAKEYVSGAIGAMLDIGKGRGPLNHFWNLK